MKQLVIVGGGGAGLTAALSARKTSSEHEITIIGNEEYSYSPCALPFILSKEITDTDKITVKFEDICKNNNIKFILEDATGIDAKKKTVKTKNKEIPYDSLVIATGGRPIIPPIKGVDLENVYTLHRIDDLRKIKAAAEKTENTVVVGGGAIGIEAAYALKKQGKKVVLIEGLEYVLSRFFGTDFLETIENKIRDNGINLIKGRNVEEITGSKKVEGVKVAGLEIDADLVIMAVGVRPNTKIFEGSGLEIAGGIKVDEKMETNIPGIYAAGDCAITKSLLTGKYTPSMLGTTAIRQGTVAGINAAGGHAKIEGTLNSMILKIFDLEAGRVGLTEKEAKTEGIDAVTAKIRSTTAAEYHPNAKPLEVKLIFNPVDETLIGAEVLGYGGVAGKIDTLTLAITKKMTCEELMRTEYCYTPPLAPSHNAITLAAEIAHKKIKRQKEKEKKTTQQ